MSSPDGRKTVFVLSGGGNLGAVQVGMLHGLLEAGIRPDAVVGTSIGALNGAFLAAHTDVAGVQELAELWASVRRRDVFPMSVRALARGVFGHGQFLFESLGLRSLLLRADVGFDRLQDAPLPFRVVATDVQSGEPVVLSRGETVRALLASAAIPGVFPPVEIGGRMLIDGGVVANTPVGVAEALDPGIVYVLPTAPDRMSEAPANAIVMMQRAMALATRTAERHALDAVSSRRTVRTLPVPEVAGRLSIFDFTATQALIDEARALTRSWLERHEGRHAVEAESTAAAAFEPSTAAAFDGAVA